MPRGAGLSLQFAWWVFFRGGCVSWGSQQYEKTNGKLPRTMAKERNDRMDNKTGEKSEQLFCRQ
jgi:hypothetical protein